MLLSYQLFRPPFATTRRATALSTTRYQSVTHAGQVSCKLTVPAWKMSWSGCQQSCGDVHFGPSYAECLLVKWHTENTALLQHAPKCPSILERGLSGHTTHQVCRGMWTLRSIRNLKITPGPEGKWFVASVWEEIVCNLLARCKTPTTKTLSDFHDHRRQVVDALLSLLDVYNIIDRVNRKSCDAELS